MQEQPGQIPVSPHADRSEEHTSELQSRRHLVCRLLLEKKNTGATGFVGSHGARGDAAHCALHRPSHSAPPYPVSTLRLRLTSPSSLARLFFFLNKRAPPEISLFPPPAPLRF